MPMCRPWLLQGQVRAGQQSVDDALGSASQSADSFVAGVQRDAQSGLEQAQDFLANPPLPPEVQAQLDSVCPAML